MASVNISSGDKIIDSRDVQLRIAELDIELQTSGGGDENVCEVDDCDESLDDGEGYGGKCGTHADMAEELRILEQLDEDGNDVADDWAYGATLIHEDYFVEYAQQLADDIGAINPDAGWPTSFIDWEAAAEALKMDYSEVDFDGETYYVR